MNNASLDEYMSLNDQLTAMVGARLPTGLQLGPSLGEAAATLERVNAGVARRMNRGEDLVTAIGQESAAPLAYRGVMEAGWRSGGIQRAIEEASRLAEMAEEAKYGRRLAWFYPAIVAGLALAGLIAFAIFVAPAISSFFQEFRIPEGATLQLMDLVRSQLPLLLVLSLIVLAVVVLALTLRRWNAPNVTQRRGRWASLTGKADAPFLARCASFCEQLSPLVEAGVPLADGAVIAAEAGGDPTLLRAAKRLHDHLEVRGDGDRRHAGDFPPFLQWALEQSGEPFGAPAALRAAAEAYRLAAARRAQQVRTGAPIVGCVLIGGTAVLIYGLVLFLPITEMLQALSR